MDEWLLDDLDETMLFVVLNENLDNDIETSASAVIGVFGWSFSPFSLIFLKLND